MFALPARGPRFYGPEKFEYLVWYLDTCAKLLEAEHLPHACPGDWQYKYADADWLPFYTMRAPNPEDATSAMPLEAIERVIELNHVETFQGRLFKVGVA
jgi:hypothetical protein